MVYVFYYVCCTLAWFVAADFTGKSKNRSRVASNMFPAEMAKSMEMSFKNWERW